MFIFTGFPWISILWLGSGMIMLVIGYFNFTVLKRELSDMGHGTFIPPPDMKREAKH